MMESQVSDVTSLAQHLCISRHPKGGIIERACAECEAIAKLAESVAPAPTPETAALWEKIEECLTRIETRHPDTPGGMSPSPSHRSTATLVRMIRERLAKARSVPPTAGSGR